MPQSTGQRRILLVIWACLVLAAVLSFLGMSRRNDAVVGAMALPTGTRLQTALGAPGPVLDAVKQSARSRADVNGMLRIDTLLALCLGVATVLGALLLLGPGGEARRPAGALPFAWLRGVRLGLVILALISALADLGENALLYLLCDGLNPTPGIFANLALLRALKLINFVVLPGLLVFVGLRAMASLARRPRSG